MKRPPLYSFVKFMAGIVSAVFTPCRFDTKQLPEGRVIVCCNHLSLMDPFYIGAVHKRNIFFMAKAELFKNKVLRVLVRALGAFPVERGIGDMDALGTARDILMDDNPLGIFIEGTRSKTGELQRPKTGAAMLAYTCHAPVMPMCITERGGGKIKLFSRVFVSCGELITPEELPITSGTGAEYRRASRYIMDKIAQLRERDLLNGKKPKVSADGIQN